VTRAWLALVVSVCVLGLAACPAQQTPCTPSDAVMAEHALECAARVRLECKGIPDNECPVVAECDAWGEARCGFAHDGGAP
jgi:hypothetical protein